jgi:DNA-binding beta-propeller fold protein YncE
LTWGRRGVSEGRFDRPRAIAIGPDDVLYTVDKAGRIQVFTADGDFLRAWRPPEIETGKPCGLSFTDDDRLLVADTHYFRVLAYTPMGELLADRTIGGEHGDGPGQFNLVTDVEQDSQGNYYVAEYGPNDRVQKLDPQRRFVMQWGGHGSAPGQFLQPRSLAVDKLDHVWVADACNHRIQVFDATGDQVRVVRVWGEQGSGPGQLSYPYGLALDGRGHVYVCEYGNNRVQKFSVEGEYLSHWGRPGRGKGELNQPWSLAIDSQGRIHVLDTHNHRVHRIRL